MIDIFKLFQVVFFMEKMSLFLLHFKQMEILQWKTLLEYPIICHHHKKYIWLIVYTFICKRL